jgi:tetratricopeptide (TPR) repeat protein
MRPEEKSVLSELATNYYNNRFYDKAAKTWARMLDPNNTKPEDLMQIGRAYYNGDEFKSADSVFNAIISKYSDYVQAYLWSARTNSKMDPSNKLGLAKPKFEKLVQVAQSDSLTNESEMIEAFNYLGYYHMDKSYNTSKDYYNRMIALNPNSRDNKIRGYSGLGMLELTMAGKEKTNEGRLPYLSRSTDSYNKILELDPNNSAARSQISYIREFEAAVRKGINPNEIKGVVRDEASGQPIAYASVRVKDTAAENLTNSKGEYKFEIPQSSEILIFSAKGYQTVEIPITKSRTYNVALAK